MLSKPEFFNTYQDFWGNGLSVTHSGTMNLEQLKQKISQIDVLMQKKIYFPASTWRKSRKLFQPIFYRNILNRYIPQFTQTVYKLVDKLMDHISGPEFDIGPYLTKLSFDMLVSK